MTKEEKKDEMKNRISMALKDPILQLCKEIAELEQKLADQKANFDYFVEGQNLKIKELEQENNKLLDVINNQDVKIADLEKQIIQIEKVSDYNADLLTKAKEILQEYIRINLLPPIERNFDDEVKLFKQAEQFLKEIEK